MQSNQPQLYGHGRAIFDDNRDHPELATQFTKAMHSVALGPSSMWPSKIDFSKYKTFLDIAGGSGAHSIAVCHRWPHLSATVFDLASVLQTTSALVQKAGLESRVKTKAGNMFKNAFPEAEVHFYSNIFHDWSPEECLELARKSYAAMPTGGRIVLHEILLNDTKSGPFVAAATQLTMLLWYHTGKKYSAKEFSDLLKQAGFKNLETIPSFGYWSLVTGVK